MRRIPPSTSDRTARLQTLTESALGLLLLGAVVMGPTTNATDQRNVGDSTRVRESIEVRLAQPLEWRGSCEADLGTHYDAHANTAHKSALLKVSIDRTNHSAETVYLPDREPVAVDLLVTRVESLSGERQQNIWLPLYGPPIDILPGWGAEPLLPGETMHLNLCFFNTTSVINLEELEGRRIPLRGKLRIRSWYFASIEDWKKNEAAHKKKDRSDENWDPSLGPPEVAFEVDLPCYGTGCGPGCNVPPWILPGEKATGIIDISARSERGAEINRELARMYPACAEHEDGDR